MFQNGICFFSCISERKPVSSVLMCWLFCVGPWVCGELVGSLLSTAQSIPHCAGELLGLKPTSCCINSCKYVYISVSSGSSFKLNSFQFFTRTSYKFVLTLQLWIKAPWLTQLWRRRSDADQQVTVTLCLKVWIKNVGDVTLLLPPASLTSMAVQPPSITAVLLLLPLLAQGQFDVCQSLRDSEGGPGWEFYACQPPPSNMKEVMQIRVDPPGITCGNPPERFCTLVSDTHLSEHTLAENSSH